MKKFKKTVAILMASVLTVGTVSSMTAGARAHFNPKEEMDKIIEDSFMIPIDGFLSRTDSEWYKNERTYLVETERDNVFRFYSINGQTPDSIYAFLSGNVDCDAIKTAIEEICPDAEYINIIKDVSLIYVYVAGKNITVPSLDYVYEDVRKNDITYEQAIAIHELLNATGELETFEYKKATVFSSQTKASFTHYDISVKESVDNYIADNDLDWFTSAGDEYAFDVSTGKRLSAEENYKISEQLYNDLGIYPKILYPDMTSVGEDITIDMHNNLKGDANDDGELRLSDAILILQSIGNPDEYQLTPQGSYNADIYGDRDGITTMDAVTVQRKILGLE